MKGLIFTFSLCISLVSCDTEAIMNIENNRTESIEIRTEGGPTNVYGELSLIAEGGDFFLHELESESSHMAIQLINESIVPSNIPFDKLEIHSSEDTIRLTSELEIFERMTLVTEDYYKIIVN